MLYVILNGLYVLFITSMSSTGSTLTIVISFPNKVDSSRLYLLTTSLSLWWVTSWGYKFNAIVAKN